MTENITNCSRHNKTNRLKVVEGYSNCCEGTVEELEGQRVSEKSRGEEKLRYSYSQRVCSSIVSGEYCHPKTGKSQPHLFPKNRVF